MFFKSKTEEGDTPVPSGATLTSRYTDATLAAAFARNTYLGAALDLEGAADALDDLTIDLQQELDFLTSLLTTSIAEAEQNRAAAKQLRALLEAERESTPA